MFFGIQRSNNLYDAASLNPFEGSIFILEVINEKVFRKFQSKTDLLGSHHFCFDQLLEDLFCKLVLAVAKGKFFLK